MASGDDNETEAEEEDETEVMVNGTKVIRKASPKIYYDPN